MANRDDRLKYLEETSDKDRCPDCAGQHHWEEIQPDGSVVHPYGEPCGTCGPGTPYPAPFTITVAPQNALNRGSVYEDDEGGEPDE